MVSIRKLTAEDAMLLSTLGGKSLLESHGHSAPDVIMQEYVNKSFNLPTCFNELEDANNIFYAIFYNNEPAGYYKIILNKPHEAIQLQPVTYMERLYVLAEFFDLKLGHLLLQHAIAQSKATSDKGMWLTVWQKNERAIRFYKKQGFEVVGESRFKLTQERYNPTWMMLLKY